MATDTKPANICIFDLQSTCWQDSVSLAALEECKQIEGNSGAYKRFNSADELFADLDNDDIEI